MRSCPAALAARGAAYLAANAALIGDAAFAGTERRAADAPRRDGGLELDLGGRTVLVEAWPTAHTNSDLTVLDSTTGTWFLGDLLFAGHVPALDGSLAGWLAGLDAADGADGGARRARARPGDAWPGPPPAARAALSRASCETDVRRMIRGAGPMREGGRDAAQVEAQHWQLLR